MDDIEFVPVICWIKQDYRWEYTAARDEVVRACRPYAKTMLWRKATPERTGLAADRLTHDALLDLQRIILDQYLPPVEPNRVRTLGRLWPWWNRTGMKVLTGGSVQTLSPLPKEDGATCILEPCGWKYRFYLNDSEERRRKWVLHLISELARKEKGATAKEQQMPEDTPGSSRSSRRSAEPSFRDDQSAIIDWQSVTDPDDWRDAALTESDQNSRQRRSRAQRVLFAAWEILQLSLTDPIANIYVDRLKKAKPGDRRALIQDFVDRYKKEER